MEDDLEDPDLLTNEELILKSIIAKIKQHKSLKEVSKILEEMKGLVTTNLSKDELLILVSVLIESNQKNYFKDIF